MAVKMSKLVCIFMLPSKMYLLRRNQPKEGPVEVDLLLQLLRREELPFALRPSGLHRRKGHVEDGALNVSVILDVEQEHRFLPGGEYGGHALEEEAEQRGEEALLGHVLQTNGDAVSQHVIGDDGDTERAEDHDTMETIWEREHLQLYLFTGSFSTEILNSTVLQEFSKTQFQDLDHNHIINYSFPVIPHIQLLTNTRLFLE